MTLNIVTANMLRTLNTTNFTNTLKRLLQTDADLIGLQEVRHRRRILEGLHGWGVWMPAHHEAAQNAILYRRSSIRLHGAGTRKMIDGAVDYPERWASWIEAEHRPSGKRIVHINTHCTSHIDKGGHPRHLPRVKDNTQHLERLVNLYRQLAPHGATFITADWNVDYRRDRRVRDPRFPYVQLTSHGLRCTYEQMGLPNIGTHGNRLIDAIYYEREARPVAQRILQSHASDHRPVMAKFKLL